MDDQQPLSLTTPQDAPGDSERMITPSADFSDVAFLPSSPSAAQLLESVVYRPGALVALALLAGPMVCAIASGAIASVYGSIPVWAPLALLLWFPALILAWALLKSVRITPDALACGRALGQWRVIPFGEIERVEQRGLRLMVSPRSGSPLSFTPLLLHRGADLRRSLLLQLPLSVLSNPLRAEAQSLSDGDLSVEGDIQGVLTVHPRRMWIFLAGGAALALLVAAVAALMTLAQPMSVALALALVALAGASCFLGLWTMQEIFVSEKGLIVHYVSLRRERDVKWAETQIIEYAPGELALVIHGARLVVCAGPGVLSATQARHLRQLISRYCLAQVAPLLSRRPL